MADETTEQTEQTEQDEQTADDTNESTVLEDDVEVVVRVTDEVRVLDVNYVDRCIWIHRDSRDRAIERQDWGAAHTWSCYVDAFQSVRVSHGLALLPAEPVPSAEELAAMGVGKHK